MSQSRGRECTIESIPSRPPNQNRWRLSGDGPLEVDSQAYGAKVPVSTGKMFPEGDSRAGSSGG
jgi:hypothetical protein